MKRAYREVGVYEEADEDKHARVRMLCVCAGDESTKIEKPEEASQARDSLCAKGREDGNSPALHKKRCSPDFRESIYSPQSRVVRPSSTSD